ncbi:response regulator [Flavobacterium sp. MAH-1]|uniref:Response regulator n=1 Tax=Flavobacterium agri TaxID=2743471 RepID=A0A7Y9C5Z7_9FLAO|nr:response regulator [Flavobacterium agri]NYA69722.1 response regulator [Flavobacterium agri]
MPTFNAMPQKRNILLSDDDNDDCSLFLEALEEVKCDADVTIARDGVTLMQALDASADEKPEVIFLDLNMPRKNGFECLHEIRKSLVFGQIPIVIYTTSNSSDIIEKVYEEGANLYMTKPSSFSLLKKTLAYVLSLAPEELNRKPSRERFVVTVA